MKVTVIAGLCGSATAAAFYANTTTTPSAIAYTTQVVTALTTICPGPTVLTFNSKTYTITTSTTLTITDCPCTVSKPIASVSQPPASETGNTCLAKCQDADNKCRTAPGANMSTCSSDSAVCKAACPAGSSQPSAPTSALAPAPTGEICLAKCQNADNKCRTAPGANMSTCSSDLAGCKAACPAVPASVSQPPAPADDRRYLLSQVPGRRQ